METVRRRGHEVEECPARLDADQGTTWRARAQGREVLRRNLWVEDATRNISQKKGEKKEIKNMGHTKTTQQHCSRKALVPTLALFVIHLVQVRVHTGTQASGMAPVGFSWAWAWARKKADER